VQCQSRKQTPRSTLPLANPNDVAGRSESHLVLEVDRRIEVRDLGVVALADDLALARMHNGSHLCSFQISNPPLLANKSDHSP
jgi:hypothetical protein